MRVPTAWESAMFAVAPLGLLAAAAFASPHLAGNGKLVTQTRTVESFTGVASEVPFPVSVTVGSPQSVSLTCDEDLMPHLITRIRDGSLSIEVKNDADLDEAPGCIANVTVPTLNALSLAGSGRIDVTGEATLRDLSLAGSGDVGVQSTKSGKLDVSLAGSGNISISGTASTIDVSLAGSGDARMAGLVTDVAEISVAGSGDVTLAVNRSVDVSLAGSGDIRVIGQPTVHQSISGSGSFRTDAPEAM